jgi:hypothetical protein
MINVYFKQKLKMVFVKILQTLKVVLLTVVILTNSCFVKNIFIPFFNVPILGDCCANTADYGFCASCKCYQEEDELSNENIPIVEKCLNYSHIISDGFCNDEANKPECDFDGGDCCLPTTLVNHCSDCYCSQDIDYTIVKQKVLCPTNLEPLLNNGHCNDEVNLKNSKFSIVYIYSSKYSLENLCFLD